MLPQVKQHRLDPECGGEGELEEEGEGAGARGVERGGVDCPAVIPISQVGGQEQYQEKDQE